MEIAFDPFQQELIKKPSEIQQVIGRFLFNLLRNVTIVRYDHNILHGVKHSIFLQPEERTQVRISVEKERIVGEKRERLLRLAIQFQKHSIFIPFAHLISMQFYLREEQRIQTSISTIPIEVVVKYGTFAKKAGIIRSRDVGEIVFKLEDAEDFFDKIRKIVDDFAKRGMSNLVSTLTEQEWERMLESETEEREEIRIIKMKEHV